MALVDVASNAEVKADLVTALAPISAGEIATAVATAALNSKLDTLLTLVKALNLAPVAAPVALLPPVAGPGYVMNGLTKFSTFSAAAAALKAGDTLLIYGQILDDSAVVNVDCTIQGATTDAGFKWTGANPAGMIWGQGFIVMNTAHLTVKGLEFQGMSSTDGNACAIRGSALSSSLTVDSCNIHDGQEGMLISAAPACVTTITNSKFAKLGAGDGQTHGIYITGASLSVSDCTFKEANGGSLIKTRTAKTLIQRCFVTDLDGTKAYCIDCCNGGDVTINNCVIEQGPTADNHSLFTYASEGIIWPTNKYHFFKNICVDDYGLINKWVVATGVTALMADIHDNTFASDNIQMDFAGPILGLNNKVVARATLPAYPAIPALPL